MSALTREQLQTRLDAYIAAEARILQSQEYTIGNGATARRNVRADLAAVQKGIADTRAEIDRLDGATARRRGPLYIRPL